MVKDEVAVMGDLRDGDDEIYVMEMTENHA